MLKLELSLGGGSWKSLGLISRKDWADLHRKLPRCLPSEYSQEYVTLHLRLSENGKPIERIQRKLPQVQIEQTLDLL